ncbi:DUF5684 domain-containing protein [Microbacterium sp. P07]|uniref:DUF5684 domain-containing protein n=1 Tax=Microbacterium sp. P07 TaxID=3366952 RepID=UPI003745E16A
MGSYNDYPSNEGIPVAVAGVLVAVGVGLLVFFAVFYVVYSLFYMKLFEKAGVEGKWRAWVPVYREMVFVKLGDLSPWWVLVLLGASLVLYLIPFVGPMIAWVANLSFTVYFALAAYRVHTKLQKDGAWIILFLFVSPVWLGIMAYDRSRWNTRIRPAAWAGNFLADKTAWQGVPAQWVHGGYAPQGYAPQGFVQPGSVQPGSSAPGAYPPPPAAPPAPSAPPTDPQPPRP